MEGPHATGPGALYDHSVAPVRVSSAVMSPLLVPMNATPRAALTGPKIWPGSGWRQRTAPLVESTANTSEPAPGALVPRARPLAPRINVPRSIAADPISPPNGPPGVSEVCQTTRPVGRSSA